MISLISSLELIDDAFIRKAILSMQEASPSGIGLLLALYRYHMPKALKGLSTPTLVLYGNREGESIKNPTQDFTPGLQLSEPAVFIQITRWWALCLYE
ncbi:hypothetical protein [Rossellomorea sp. RS05]|uniref:hypothetical protein n=1 Tax=Rossellomorea sp. RS05 TaxID=3149166 RepID=UPI003221ECD9